MRSILAALSLLFAIHCAAQTTEADIAARLVGKPLLMRGFWADDKLTFDAAGKPLGNYKTESFTESGIDVLAVHLHGTHLTLEGRRVAIAFDTNGDASRQPVVQNRGVFGSSPEKVTIQIDQDSPDFTPALDVIFAKTLAEITPGLPDYWQPFAHEHFLHEPPSPKSARAEPAGGPTHHIGGDVKPPHLLRSVDPHFTEAARSRKFSGNVQVYLWLEPDGTPSHIRIVRPVSMGLDEEAVTAVAKYKFAPATQNGNPVRVDLYIDVNFQIF